MEYGKRQKSLNFLGVSETAVKRTDPDARISSYADKLTSVCGSPTIFTTQEQEQNIYFIPQHYYISHRRYYNTLTQKLSTVVIF